VRTVTILEAECFRPLERPASKSWPFGFAIEDIYSVYLSNRIFEKSLLVDRPLIEGNISSAVGFVTAI
jgi:hypothetical protein